MLSVRARPSCGLVVNCADVWTVSISPSHDRHRRMRLHRRLVLIGRGIVRLDLYRRAGECGFEIADGTVGGQAAIDPAGFFGGRTGRVEVIIAAAVES